MLTKFTWKDDLVQLKKHLEDFEQLLQDSKKRINSDADEFPIDKYPEDERGELVAGFTLDEIFVDEYIAPFHYRAIFLLIYGWFEHGVSVNCCVKADRKFWEKFKKSLPEKTRKDLTDSPEWCQINDLAKIRNLVMHNDSFLKLETPDRMQVEKFVRDNSDKIEFAGVYYDFGAKGKNYPREIKVNKLFCEYVLSIFESFLGEMERCGIIEQVVPSVTAAGPRTRKSAE